MAKKERRQILAGNWKMNKTIEETVVYLQQLLQKSTPADLELLLAIPFTALYAASSTIKDSKKVVIGAQNMYDAANGAYTGEISASMIKEAGAHFVIIGHSERRTIFFENDFFISRKVKSCLSAGLAPLLCIGENEQQLAAHQTEEVLKKQIATALQEISSEEAAHLMLAYEPVWAIGTGKSATAEQAQKVHSFCRQVILELFGEKIAIQVPILYGGSVKPENAKQFGLQKDIDGLLVGGASLSLETYMQIAEAFI